MAPPSRITLIRRAIAKNEDIRSTILGTGANDLAAIFLSAEQEILRLLIGSVSGPRIDPVRAELLSESINQIIRRDLTVPGTQWVNRNVPVIYNLGIEQGARSVSAGLGVGSFAEIPSEKVRQTFLTFTEGAEFKGVVDLGFKKWLAEIQLTEDLMMRSIRDVLTQGAISGSTNAQIVDNLLRDGQFKGITTSDGRKISAADRAKTLVRTEGQRSVVQAEVAVSGSAGFEGFISVGVADNRRSAICEVSQRQPPHTIGWWISSFLGIAPRHVANCRDEMVPIELDTFTNADARTLGIRGYNSATFSLDNGKASGSENRRLRREVQRAEQSKSGKAAKGRRK